MKIALYGMPGAGKTHILERTTFMEVISGSQLLRQYVPDFDQRDETGRCEARKDLAKKKLLIPAPHWPPYMVQSFPPLRTGMDFSTLSRNSWYSSRLIPYCPIILEKVTRVPNAAKKPITKSCIAYIEDSPFITAYTITNGTIHLPDSEIRFLEDHAVNVGFSIDGHKELHNLYRCGSFGQAMSSVEQFKRVTGHYPTFNATVGEESLKAADKVIGCESSMYAMQDFKRGQSKSGSPFPTKPILKADFAYAFTWSRMESSQATTPLLTPQSERKA